MPIRAALWFFLPLIFACDVTFPDAGAAKMTIQELLARHLDSIGTPEAHAAAKNVVGSGTSQVVFRIPGTGQLSGTGSVLSEGRMIRIEMVFAAQDYQSERLVFNGNNVDVGQIQILERSMLSDFIYHYGMGMLKEGLMGGAMTTAWAMLDVPGRQPKLDYSGLKKVGGKNMHELRYRPKKDPGDLQITLYFGQETFRHLYSQYRMVIRGGVGQRTRPTLADPGGTAPEDSFFKLEEWFEDFKTVDGLTLPHKYRIRFNREGPNPFLCEYGITLTRVLHNQTIDPKSFIIAK